MKKNVILTDSTESEIESFAEGISITLGNTTRILSYRSDWSQKNKLMNIYRYIRYFICPFTFFLFHRKEYEIIIGWQQFYATLFAFYCKLFHVKKTGIVVVCNFTYKRKSGIIGKVYHLFMKYALNNSHIDYLHVPSYNYAQVCCEVLGVPRDKFIVAGFGVPDIYDTWKNSTVNCDNYVLSIGRSNRDFDFLIQAWSDPRLNDCKLIIISDTYCPLLRLSSNIKVLNNISGDAQFPWIFNANWIIIPIADGQICSGDTVLLNSMVFEKTVVVTKPSTLQEMYIIDGVNGCALEKDKEKLISFALNALEHPEELKCIGKQARQSYLKKNSRYSMGENIGKHIAL